MDPSEIRRRSLETAAGLGYELNENLPLLEPQRPRDQEVVAKRCLALHCAVAVAYGFDRKAARDWIDREGLEDFVASSERAFLAGEGGDANEFRARVEAVHAFAWALGLRATLDFGAICDDALITEFPDLKKMAPAGPFLARVQLRKADDLTCALDLAYCIHWAITAAVLARDDVPGHVPAYVVIERRWALEWILSGEEWDEISLDT